MDLYSLFDYVREESPARERLDIPRQQPEPANRRESVPTTPQAQILEVRNRAPKLVFNPNLERNRDERSISNPLQPLEPSRDAVERSPDIPRLEIRKRRSLEPENSIGIRLRPEEKNLLFEVGRFRVIASADLCRTLYAENDGRLKRDLAFLRQNRLVDVHLLTARRDGRSASAHRFEAVTLTKSGRKLVEQSGIVPEGQRIYSDLVKPREVEHDSQIYRAYLKEWASIEREGGSNPRAKLDFEIKASVQRAMYLARKEEPDRELSDIKADVAEQFNLSVINDRIVIPDARIEYETPGGGTSHIDLEVATSAYRHSHIQAKATAGFRLYIAHGDIGRLGAAVEDDRHHVWHFGLLMALCGPIQDLIRLRYTDREASFLYLVGRFSGYFIGRQYAAFLKRKPGGLVYQLMHKAKARGHIKVLDYGQHCYVYHLKAKPIYRLLECEDSQARRAKGDDEIKTRLMILDYVLDHLDAEFLALKSEKIEYFATKHGVEILDGSDAARPRDPNHFSVQLNPFAYRFPLVLRMQNGECIPAFTYFDNDTMTVKAFSRQLKDLEPIIARIQRFEIIYVALWERNFAAAEAAFDKVFPQIKSPGTHSLVPFGPEHLVNFFLADHLFCANSPQFRQEHLLMLRDGQRIYQRREHDKLRKAWRQGDGHFDEQLEALTGIKRLYGKLTTVLLTQSYPLFRHARRRSIGPTSVHGLVVT